MNEAKWKPEFSVKQKVKTKMGPGEIMGSDPVDHTYKVLIKGKIHSLKSADLTALNEMNLVEQLNRTRELAGMSPLSEAKAKGFFGKELAPAN